MRRPMTVDFEFVEFIPSDRAPATLYISIEYATVVHDCLCGCGTKVVTPLNPTGWTLSFDGETVSLDPSVGNWSFECRSHYIIDRNRVIWAADMTPQQIERGRNRDRKLRDRHYGGGIDRNEQSLAHVTPPTPPQTTRPFWKRWLGL